MQARRHGGHQSIAIAARGRAEGARYNRETLDVTFKGKDGGRGAGHPCEEALECFVNQRPIAQPPADLVDAGLDYIRLGSAGADALGW